MEMPSTNPSFVGIIVAIHMTLGLAAVIAGAVAMLRRKGHGRHSVAGNLYYWCLAALFALATLLSVMRWAEDHDLFIFSALALITGTSGELPAHGRLRAVAPWNINHVRRGPFGYHGVRGEGSTPVPLPRQGGH